MKRRVAHRTIHIAKFEGFRRYSVAHFLVALVIMFITSPFLRLFRGGDLIEKAIGTLVLLSAVTAIGGRRRTLVTGALLVMPALAAKWIDHLRPGVIPQEVIFASMLAFAVFVVIHLLRFVLQAPRVNAEVLCAGIATFLMLGLCWAVVFTLVAKLDPGAFTFTLGHSQYNSMVGFEALYFSIGTLSGVCYGDIIPVSGGARMLALLEGMVGLFYLAVLISRLVSLYSSDKSSSTAAK